MGILAFTTSHDVYPPDPDFHFVSIEPLSAPALILIVHLSKYHKHLPQNTTRPEGELVEATISLFNVQNGQSLLSLGLGAPSSSFVFLSDSEMVNTIANCCWGFTSVISDPTPFNSTGNIQLGSVVQHRRGGAAQMVLHENATKLSGIPPWEQDPPFPLGVDLEV